MTVARSWIASVDEAEAEAYERFAREVSLPMFKSQRGYEGALMLRNGSTCLVLTLWQDMDAAQALASSATYAEAVRAISTAGFLKNAQPIELFSVHLADLPAAIREGSRRPSDSKAGGLS